MERERERERERAQETTDTFLICRTKANFYGF